MAVKTCASCGADVPGAALFCTQCGGRDLVEPSAPVHQEPPPPAPSVVTEAEAPSTPPPSSATAAVPVEPTANPWTSPPPVVGGSHEPTAPVDAPEPVTTPVPPASGPTIPTTPGVGGGGTGDPTRVQGQVPPPTPPVAPPVPPGSAGAVPAQAAESPPGEATGGGGRIGAFFGLLGGAAAIAGAFLEWMKLDPVWASPMTFSGWDLTDDAKIAAALGACAVICAFVVLAGQLRQPVRLLLALLGLATLGLGAYDTYDIVQKLPDALKELGVTGFDVTAPGVGLIAVMAGGAVMILGALLMRPRKSGQGSSTPPPRDGTVGTVPPSQAPPQAVAGYQQPTGYPQAGGQPLPTSPTPPAAPPSAPGPPTAPWQ